MGEGGGVMVNFNRLFMVHTPLLSATRKRFFNISFRHTIACYPPRKGKVKLSCDLNLDDHTTISKYREYVF